MDAEHVDVMSSYEEVVVEAHHARLRAQLEVDRSRTLRLKAQSARRAALTLRLPKPFEPPNVVDAA